jgi:hypothetical protein
MMKRTAIALFGIILSLILSMGFAWGEARQDTETFYGLYAGYWYPGGTYNNTFIGNSAGNDNTSGESNVFIGHRAGYKNTTGDENSFVGFTAGQENLTGQQNTYMGKQAGAYGINGLCNSFFGFAAGTGTSGSYNTFIGSSAGVSNTTGYNNTYVGQAAGFHATGYGNVFIGNGAGFNEPGNNQLRIDNYINSGTSPLIWGDFAAGVVKINGQFFIVSDGRFKKNIEPLQTALDKVMNLKGVRYEWNEKNGFGKRKEIGFIAQDVESVIPELVHTDDKGYKSVAYDKLAPVLVEAIKEQQKTIAEKSKIIDEQQIAIRALTERLAKVDRLEADVNKLKSKDMSVQK